jgi:hypothetical protein
LAESLHWLSVEQFSQAWLARLQTWPPLVQFAAVVWQLPTTQTLLMQMRAPAYSDAHCASAVHHSQNSEVVLQTWLVVVQSPAARQLPWMQAPAPLHR